jgi:hypothetical protein
MPASHGPERILSGRGSFAGDREWFGHWGPVAADTMVGMLATLEGRAASAGLGTSVVKRLIALAVEGIENVRLHSAQEAVHRSACWIGREDDHVLLVFSNPLPHATAALLESRIAVLNLMDRDELRQHHLTLLADRSRSDHGGAGLGLITMARKADGALHFSSSRMDDQLTMAVIAMRVDL